MMPAYQAAGRPNGHTAGVSDCPTDDGLKNASVVPRQRARRQKMKGGSAISRSLCFWGMKAEWKVWAKGNAAALIGVARCRTCSVTAPGMVNGTRGSSGINAAAYLKKSPLPVDEKEEKGEVNGNE